MTNKVIIAKVIKSLRAKGLLNEVRIAALRESELNSKSIDDIDEFRDFINDYSEEILDNLQGESDGWNQKITIINRILQENNIEISDTVYDNEEYEEIINSI